MVALSHQNPIRKRVTITPGATEHNPPFRGIIVDVAGTVTIQNTETEAAAVVVPVAAGVPIGLEFNKLIAADGPTVIIGCL